MNKIMPIIAVVITMTLFSTGMAYATSHNVSIFSDAIKYADSNSYKNSNYSISIQQPTNWIVVTNLPPSVSNQSIVTFSNNDKTQLATFGISHRYIASNVIEAINNHSDNDVLATIAQEMTYQDADSKTIVYNGIVDRYTDGVRVTVSSATQYTANNSTLLNENIFYFLDNGNQYTLELTSNQDNIDKNSQLFEDSASTFVASQTNPVPEFPISLTILITGMFAVIFIFRVKGITGTTGHA
ncbi:MAG: hypothetical protein ACREAR_02450 [Nitrosotalea sp.]